MLDTHTVVGEHKMSEAACGMHSQVTLLIGAMLPLCNTENAPFYCLHMHQMYRREQSRGQEGGGKKRGGWGPGELNCGVKGEGQKGSGGGGEE